jgi:hypothetical protein
MSGKRARLATGVLPPRLTVATGADGVHQLSAVPVEPTAAQLWRWWWLHDGCWYDRTVALCGVERANEINRQVLRFVAQRVARTVARTAQRRIGQMPWPDVVQLYVSCPRLMWPARLLQADYRITGPGRFEANVVRNYALTMLLRHGGLDGYRCPCLDLRQGWFEGLGLPVVEDVCVQCLRTGGSACTFLARVAGYGDD